MHNIEVDQQNTGCKANNVAVLICTLRPVYTQIQIRVHFKEIVVFLEQLRVFSAFSHRPRAVLSINVVFATLPCWKAHMTILVICKRFGNRRLHYAGLRFIPWQEHLFSNCLGVFSIISFLFYFVLSENNLKIISTRLPQKWQMLILCSENTSLTLNCQGIQCRDYTKHNIETTLQWKVTRLTHAP